jgi:hypothetical protein
MCASDWAQVVARRYASVLQDDLLVDADQIFGSAWCSTVGWAGDLCITYDT